MILNPFQTSIKSLLAAVFLATASFMAAPAAHGQATSNVACTAPGIGDYGTGTTDQRAIDSAAELGPGTPNDNTYQAAIRKGQTDRGTLDGCPDKDYDYDSTAATTKPTYAQALNVWNTIQVPFLSTQFDTSCPGIGRDLGASALAAFYAQLAGVTINSQVGATVLGSLNMLVATQSVPANYNGTVSSPGAFGYIEVPAPTDTTPQPCFLTAGAGGDELGDNVNAFCDAVPSACVTYTGGTYAHKTFQIADLGATSVLPDGSMDFDHGFASAGLMEATMQLGRVSYMYLPPLQAAAAWSVKEPAVRNVNYSAKLVWALAQMYDRTQDPQYLTALNNKLARGLLDNMLMPDPTDSRYVINLGKTLMFTDLTKIAQRPGRMYDGHNSLPEYQADNTVALIEAYVALRDNNQPNAATVRPYVIAALNNIANEVNYQGIPSRGKSQVPTALLLGLWKIYKVESPSNGAGGGSGITNWENAAWRYWNQGAQVGTVSGTTGAASGTGPETLNAALYLLYLSNTSYVPLFNRTVQ